MTIPILQHYYTSYRDEATKQDGFRTKATSPAVTSEMEQSIFRLIDYEIPPSLPSREITTHPVALRYYYEGPDRGFLLCSQSCGSDSNNRPGNFFAHTLVIQPIEFTLIPPIFYWKSPFWQKEDRVQRSHIDSLPSLSQSDLEKEFAIEIDDVWNFLAQGERRQHLYKLLCALIHSKKTSRRVVILDSTEHVACWIAAASTLLPPAYRPLLTFATYHHRPAEGLYLVTGTTHDQFQGSQGAYFVLNAEGISSAGEDSPYAQRVVQASQPDRYDSLLTLFSNYADRFPPSTAIDEQLDLLALYAGLFEPRSEAELSPRELDALDTALLSFGQPHERDSEELSDLKKVLANVQQNPRTANALNHVQALLSKYTSLEVRTSEEPRRKQQIEEARIEAERKALVALSTFSLSQLSLADCEMYRKYQHHQSLSNANNARVTLLAVLALVDGQLDKRQQQYLYEQGKMLLPSEYRSVVKECIVGIFQNPFTPKTQSDLVGALFTRNHDFATVFWQIYWEAAKGMLARESTASKFVDVLDFWFNARPDEFHQPYVVQEFFLLLPTRLREIQQERCYQDGLNKFRQVADQPRNWWYPIVQDYLVEKKGFVEVVRGVMAQKVQWFLRKDNEDTAQEEQRQMLAEKVAALFEEKIAQEQHYKRLADLYQQSKEQFQSQEPFWSAYWRLFKEVMLSRDAEHCLTLLVFWFDESFKKLAGVRYAPQEFFMGFSKALEEARQENGPGFSETARQIQERLAPLWRECYLWYPLLKKYFADEKKGDG